MTHQERIASLRTTIATDEQTIAELRIKRTALLTADDDDAIGKIESEIDRLQRRIGLSQERIAATEQAERDAAQQAHEQHLDALAAKAEKARSIGTGLLQDYAKHAGALAAVLSKLAAVEHLIDDTNRTLAKASRTTIAPVNAERCRAARTESQTTRRTVGIGEACHPLYDVADTDMNGITRNRLTGEQIERFSEQDVTERVMIPGIFAEPLPEMVRLPSSVLGSADLWPRLVDADSVLQALGLTEAAEPGPIKKLLERVIG